MKRLIKKSNLKKMASWNQLETERKLAVGDYGKGDKSVETFMQKGVLSIDELDQAIGFNGEKREWTENVYGPGRYFGLYPEEKWNEFLEDIKTNGVKDPIVVEIHPDGQKYIWEGNHRLEAIRQLGLNEIPAKVMYMGGSQEEYKIA